MTLPAPGPSRRARRRGPGLTPQLFLFVILPLTVLLVVISFGSLALHSQAMRALVAEREARTVHAAADAISQQLHDLGRAVALLAAHDGTSPSSAKALTDFADLRDDFRALAIVDDSGEILATNVPEEMWTDVPLAQLVAQSLASGEASFSDPLSFPLSDEPLMVVAFHGPSDRSAVGAFMAGDLAERVLGDAFPPESQARAALIDADLRLLFGRGEWPPDTDLASYSGLEAALQGQDGVEVADSGGQEVVIAYSPVSPLGWVLLMEEPWEALDNPLLRGTQAAPLILIPALLFALLAVVFGLRQVVQPLQALEHKAADLGQSRFETIEQPVGGIEEIQSLQRTLVEMARQLRASRDAIRRYVGALTGAQEEERRRLARELHDQTVQSLIALDQHAQIALMAVPPESPDAIARLTELRQLTASLLDELRRVIRGLRPIYLEDLGLLAALEILAGETQTATGTPVVIDTVGVPLRLTPEREIAVFRIAQEAFSNIERHAQAGHVDLRVEFRPGHFLLTIRDDGRGFTSPPALADLAAADHYGLLGMQERAERIGSRLDLRSSPDAGTTVSLDVPL
ncbi:MAG TPA: histidine kinase [Anaerolineales bacterium]|nr:histidine kinase [Anaerolineales bacterium]